MCHLAPGYGYCKAGGERATETRGDMKEKSSASLSFHVPEPEVRPGEPPDFSHVQIPKAGSVPRPPVDVDPREIRDLAYSIIRVLNRQGEAVGPWAGTLSDEELLEGLRHMMTLRRSEEHTSELQSRENLVCRL